LFPSKIVAIILIFCGLAASLPGESAPPAFTLAFGGDVMLGRGVARALAGEWPAAFAGVARPLAEADLTFANLESPLTTAPPVSNGHDLRAMPSAVNALSATGFDVVSLSNNHALDAGEAGLVETIATLDSAGITGVTSRTAGQLVSRTSHSTLRYQLFAFDDSGTPLDLEAAARSVAAAKQADLVIVSLHWGGEYQAAPSPRQRYIAQSLVRAGADLIIGHGPHVLQPVELIGKALVAYSLGNLLFDQLYPDDCRWGVILRVTLTARGIMRTELLPTVEENGQARFASPGEAHAILERLSP
jgi:poly-gamma-glutamate capsule biosynthesis protein CapA/YwtB (metallophosphatase superfamily)